MQTIQSFYQDTFVAWIHLKAIRVFVESVLRYGLPVEKFSAAVFAPQRNKEKLLRSALDEMFKTNNPAFQRDVKDTTPDPDGEDFYPYVWVNVPLE